MKRKISITLLTVPLLFAVWLAAYGLASGPLIEDEHFEEAVREEINYERGEIRPDQLAGIQELRLRERSISTLAGIEHMTSLTSLDLRDNNISDISLLENLTDITDLNLRGNRISNIAPLENLTEIENLNMRENNIMDISALQSMHELRDLNIRHNNITNLSPLENLPNLRERLYLEGNPVTDFSPVLDYAQEIGETDIDVDGFSSSSADFSPVFSQPGGFYENDIELELTTPLENTDIYYTLDGSTPDPAENSGSTFEYTEPLIIEEKLNEEGTLAGIPTNFIDGRRGWNEPEHYIDQGTVVRAVIAEDGEAVSDVATQSYFINITSSLPVFSLTTDAANFFNDETGIYVPGVHYDGGDSTGNYYQRGREWERPLHVEYYEADGRQTISQDAGVRIHGGYTRRFGQKSLRLYARNDYSESRFNYQFFDDKELDSFSRLLLRHFGNDWGMTMFRDGAMQSLVDHLDFDRQHYQPSIVFLNGEYWGIHNIRDRLDNHHLEIAHGVDRDHVTILDNQWQVSDGYQESADDYQDMIDYANTNDLSEEEHYRHIESLMDIDNYRQYYITQIYNANSDWPHNNISYWRYENINNTPENELADELDGRWRWLLYDVDRSLGYESYDHNTIEMATSELNPRHDEEWPNILFRALLENEGFMVDFLNEFADHLNTTFTPERVINTIDEKKAVIEPEIERHLQRWGIPESVEDWEDETAVMREFAEVRPGIVRQQLAEHFDLPGTADLTANFNSDQGTVQINSIELTDTTPGIDNPDNWTGQYFQGIPVTVTAVPEAGYEFAGWGEDIDSDSDTIEIVLDGDLTLEPEFN